MNFYLVCSSVVQGKSQSTEGSQERLGYRSRHCSGNRSGRGGRASGGEPMQSLSSCPRWLLDHIPSWRASVPLTQKQKSSHQTSGSDRNGWRRGQADGKWCGSCPVHIHSWETGAKMGASVTGTHTLCLFCTLGATCDTSMLQLCLHPTSATVSRTFF